MSQHEKCEKMKLWKNIKIFGLFFPQVRGVRVSQHTKDPTKEGWNSTTTSVNRPSGSIHFFHSVTKIIHWEKMKKAD